MRSRNARGVSLVETMIALGLLAIGMLGLAQMQVTGVRANGYARRAMVASALARDLVENVSLWSYHDPRLAPLARVTSMDDTQVVSRLEPGSDEVLGSDARMQFGELPGDPSAIVPGALGTYAGVASDLDHDGAPDFRRYWSVFAHDPSGGGVEDSKLVVVVIRWKEPGTGMRQVVSTTVRANREAFGP